MGRGLACFAGSNRLRNNRPDYDDDCQGVRSGKVWRTALPTDGLTTGYLDVPTVAGPLQVYGRRPLNTLIARRVP